MSGAIVRSTGLTKRYGTAAVLDQVDLEVPEGSVYGLVGPNGAGKTTLLSIIAGLRSPTSGTVELAVDLAEVAVCPDAPEFEPWLTASEVLQLSASLSLPRHSPPRSAEAIGALLAEAGLGESADRRVGGFSRGMTQRLALAATVVGEPKLIILDEPCSALDPAGRAEVLDMITRLAAQATVIFSSHILADVERVCTSVGVLRKGRLRYQGSLRALLDTHVGPRWIAHVREPVSAVAGALRAEGWVKAVTDLGGGRLRIEAASLAEGEQRLAGALDRAGARVVSVEPEVADLEAIFLSMTGEPLEGAGAPEEGPQ